MDTMLAIPADRTRPSALRLCLIMALAIVVMMAGLNSLQAEKAPARNTQPVATSAKVALA
ncbi:MAG: hypothetical protein R3D84_05080 [Paracoccaceae bacterium]